MDKKLVWIYIWIVFWFLYIWFSVYDYKFWDFTENEVRELKKDLDIQRLPKIDYDEKTIDKLYNSISLEKEYNKNK
jgi:hypothetical protein